MIQNILVQLTISLYSNKRTCLTWGELSSLHRESSHSPINKHQGLRGCDTTHHVVITCFSQEDWKDEIRLCLNCVSPFFTHLLSILHSFLVCSHFLSPLIMFSRLVWHPSCKPCHVHPPSLSLPSPLLFSLSLSLIIFILLHLGSNRSSRFHKFLSWDNTNI